MNSSARFHRLVLFSTLFCLLLLSVLNGRVSAEAPMAKFQAPGFYRLMLGQFEITALCDGFVDLDVKLLHNAPETEIQELLTRLFVSTPKMSTAVNAYVLNTGAKLILIDAGTGNAFGPILGYLPKNLAAAGYTPDQVDLVLVTHMHIDHIAGLLDADGKPVYSKAAVMVSKAEQDYWLSDSEMEKAPANLQKFFKLAREVQAVYANMGKWKTFEGGQLFPGVKATILPGHTPGHTIFEITSNDRSLFVLGDMVHSMAVQFSRPDVSFEFDKDPKQAVAARHHIFRDLAESKAMIAGMHLPFPGIGHILSNGNNSYTWTPVEYAPVKD